MLLPYEREPIAPGVEYWALKIVVVRYFEIELKNTIAIQDATQAREEPIIGIRDKVVYHLNTLKRYGW